MKKILLSILLLLNILLVSAQETKDSVEVTIDTLNLSGIVLNEHGKPMKNIKVNTMFSQSYTFTDANGKFYFPSLNTTDRIYVVHDQTISWENINGSRFIKFIINPMPDYDINMQGYGFREYLINAKRSVEKSRKKIRDNNENIPIHALIGHYFPPSYAGGLDKFYKYIISNVNYPKEAINKNAEGMVKIAFVVKKYGGIKNIEVIRDIGYGCAQEVIRVLKTTEKKWNPASNMDLVDQRVVFQIPFKLIDQ